MWTAGIFPPSSFVMSPKCSISGKCRRVMEMGAFSISLAQSGVMPWSVAARGNTPMPSKRLPSVIFSILPIRVSPWDLFQPSPGVVDMSRYSSVSLGMVLEKGTRAPPIRRRPWPASALVM